MRAWVNGRLLDREDEPALVLADHGFTVGDGVFETLKVVDGEAFALTRHLDRLRRSAEGLGLQAPADDDVRTGIAAALADHRWPLGRIRVTFSAGAGPMGSGRDDGPGTLAVLAGPAKPWEPTTAVATVPWTRNERSAVVGLKTTSYAENVVALAAAHEKGASEAIFANTVGDLCEGTGSNVFYVVDGQLRTPSLAAGCLAGITRALVLEWYGAAEVDEPIGVLAAAEEVFLTSSTRDVHPVQRCDDLQLDAPGPVTREVLSRWAEASADCLDP